MYILTQPFPRVMWKGYAYTHARFLQGEKGRRMTLTGAETVCRTPGSYAHTHTPPSL